MIKIFLYYSKVKDMTRRYRSGADFFFLPKSLYLSSFLNTHRGRLEFVSFSQGLCYRKNKINKNVLIYAF